ncbi:MAG: class E sortase [Actinobacteria bacterium]|nr:class E sortase [Actinomycetota bacterium]
MFFTNLLNERSQGALLEQWELEYGPIDEAAPVMPEAPSETAGEPSSVEVGDAYAVMWFERPAADERPVYAEPLSVVEGIDPESLKLGPGHYPDTAAPGQPGNFAIAGHRTTYGAPFYDLDQIRSGDEIHVIDRDRQRWVYEVIESRVVLPHETWVIESDPLGRGRPILSLTTCEPRFSAEKRLMVFAELREPTQAAAA